MPSSWAAAKASETSTICRLDSLGAEVDRRADGHRAHLARLLDLPNMIWS